MTRRSRFALAAVAAAAGLAGAGAAAGALERRRIQRRVGDVRDLGSLRSDALTVTCADGVGLHVEVDELDEPEDVGPGTAVAPTLVFIHGYALNLDCWHFQRAHFRGSRRMVFYDQRSHGRSQRSSPGHATIDQLGDDLHTVLDHVVPDGPVVLVGHSMGGMTIMAFAESYPELFSERVAGVALVSTTAGGLRPARMVLPFVPDWIGGQFATRAMAALAHGPSLVDRARRAGSDIGFVITDRFAFGDKVPAEYVSFVDQMLSRTSFDVLAEFFPNFEVLDKFAVLEAFVHVPTVIVCGTRDRLTSIGHSRKMASMLPDARLVEAESAGHMVILERHELVSETLEKLVSDTADIRT